MHAVKQNHPRHLVLNELFEFFPKKLELIGECANYPVYSNDTIQQTTINWLSRSKSSKDIVDIISDGMTSRKILIGFTNPSTLAFIKNRFKIGVSRVTTSWFGWDIMGQGEGVTLGLYCKTDGQIAIFLDPSVNILGKALTSIPSIITHELCHKIAADMPNEYLRFQVDNLLVPYYSEVFKCLDSRFENIDQEKLKIAIKNVTLSVEGKSNGNLLRDVIKHWWTFFSHTGLNDSDAETMVYKVLLPFYTFIINERLGGCPSELQNRSKEFLECFYRGYDVIDVEDARSYTLAGQEAIFTSEVVAIANEWAPDSDTINMIHKLKFN